MVHPKQLSLHNRLLRALAPEDFALVAPHLEPVALPKGRILIEPNQPIEHVTFPETGVASVVALSPDNQPVEIAIVGWEGLVGPSVVLASTARRTRAFSRWMERAIVSPPRT